LSESRQQKDSISRKQRLRVEPQTGKDSASHNAILARRQPAVFVLLQNPPIDLAVLGSPDHILLHTGTAIGSDFFLRVEGSTAGGHLDYKLRSALEVTHLVKAGGPAALRNKSQESVGLGNVVRTQAKAGVRGGLCA
jgi:hypothetical protein